MNDISVDNVSVNANHKLAPIPFQAAILSLLSISIFIFVIIYIKKYV